MDDNSRGTEAAFQKEQRVAHYQIVELLTPPVLDISIWEQQRDQPNAGIDRGNAASSRERN